MKILYGVQGTGNGHISRARMMARHLGSLGVDVAWLFSGRPRENYFDMDIFGDFLCRRGLTFSYSNGRVSYLDTLRSNRFREFIADIRHLEVDDYDLVLTDYEPITAWAARLKRKTVIGVGHQYAFLHPVPMEGDNRVSRWLLRHFAPANISFGLHWSHFGHDILPPIVDPDLVHSQAPESGQNKVLVYLPFENQPSVTAMLKQIPGHDFFQYAPALSDARDGNVNLRKTCHSGFRQDLCSASAVICNAGFELVSECLHMGLPVLVKPLQQQTEQLSNARALETLGLARRIDSLAAEPVRNWLQGNPSQHARRQNYPDVAKAISHWIVAGDYSTPAALSRSLWPEQPATGIPRGSASGTRRQLLPD